MIHDTTEFGFSTNRSGLGYVNEVTQTNAFFGHFALAVSSDDNRIPLGVIDLETYVRTGPKKRKKSEPKGLNKESERWARVVQAVEDRLAGQAQAIHVMDREGDIYEALDLFCLNNFQFVIRICYDRALKNEPGSHLSEALTELPCVFERQVEISARSKNKSQVSKSKSHPERKARKARLGFSATSVEIRRPHDISSSYSRSLKLNVVQVEEIDAPEGELPIQWRLMTLLPIDTTEQIVEIVDIYRSRWLIEEYFKILKTGCKYEQRQLESIQTLFVALGLFIPVAHRLLMMRNLSRVSADLPSKLILSETQITI